jgi:DNA-binding response OmpR family regulator
MNEERSRNRADIPFPPVHASGPSVELGAAALDPAAGTVALWVDLEAGTAGIGSTMLSLAGPEVIVLAVLLTFAGRVVSRELIARKSGLRECSQRRVDSLLVGIRKAVGADAIRTVRGRGWMLDPTKVVVPTGASRGASLLRVVADPADHPPADRSSGGDPGPGVAWT